MSNESLTWDVLRDTIQTAINTTTPIWYSTSDTIERGKVLASPESTPPFVIIHPDDSAFLPSGARHLREYRPTRAELAAEAQACLDKWREQPIDLRQRDPHAIEWIMRLRGTE